MPKTENGHTETYWIRVKTVSSFLLSNQEYIASKRVKDLVRVVMDEFNLESTMANELIKEAKKDIKQCISSDVEKLKHKALRDREDHIRALKLQIEDSKKPSEKARFHQLLLQARKDRDELCGLYEQKIKQSGDVVVRNIDMNKFTEHGLERLKKGDKIEDVLTDPKSIRQDAN